MRVTANKYLHKPFRLLWFESDEIFLFFVGIMLGIYVSFWFVPLFFVLALFVRKAKEKQARGFVKHFFYYFGFLRFKGYPTFFESKFQE